VLTNFYEYHAIRELIFIFSAIINGIRQSYLMQGSVLNGERALRSMKFISKILFRKIGNMMVAA
jgi:hypothetical protein